MAFPIIFSSIKYLVRNKRYIFSNSFILAVGIVVYLSVNSYLSIEKSYDGFYPNSNNIYRVEYNLFENKNSIYKSAKVQSALHTKLSKVPGVKSSCRMTYDYPVVVFKKNSKPFPVEFYWVDSTFLNVFGINLVYGDKKTALKEVHSAIISKSTALKLFGTKNPIGETLYVNESIPFTIKGVFNDLPYNSHLKYDVLVTISSVIKLGFEPNLNNTWGFENTTTYTHLNPKIPITQIQNKIDSIAKEHLKPHILTNQSVSYTLNAITNLHFTDLQIVNDHIPTINLTMLNVLMIINSIILLIVIMNIINSNSIKYFCRLDEFNIRKVNGAKKEHIVAHTIVELTGFSILTMGLVVVLYYICIQLLSQMLNIPSQYFYNQINEVIPWILLTLLLIILINTLIINNVSIKYKVANSINRKNTNSIFQEKTRKLLFIIQFSLFVFMLIVLFIIIKQIYFLKNSDLGFELEHKIAVMCPVTLNLHPDRKHKHELFKNRVQQLGFVKNVCESYSFPGKTKALHTSQFKISSRKKEYTIIYSTLRIDQYFLNTMGIELIAGENLKKSMNNNKVLINETMSKKLGFDIPQDAAGEIIYLNTHKIKIIGIVKDFHQSGFKTKTTPLIFIYNKIPYYGFFTFKITDKYFHEKISMIKEIWEQQFPNDYFKYIQYENYYNSIYKTEIQFIKITSFLIIIVFLMVFQGIISISILHTKQKVKELSIRKAFGAKISQIIYIIPRMFIRDIIISWLLASPIAWLTMNKWLNTFAYKTNLNWWIFFLPAVIIIIIVLITSSMISLRAARKNPIEAIRDE